ncbi:MAG: hypothetical protein AAFY08_16330 [Planctomycetota bacterium]
MDTNSYPEDDPYAEGVEAYHSGFDDSSNPYGIRTPDHLAWNDGWNAAAALDDEGLEDHLHERDD